jgi:hypothetical protein
MATTAIYNFPTQKTGSTFKTLPLQILLGGSPISILNYDFELQFRRQVNGVAELSLGVGTGITVVDDTIGKIEIDSFLIALTPAKYLWDLRMTDDDGNISYPIGGAWEIISNITR